MGQPWLAGGLLAVTVLVLMLPFFSHRVDQTLKNTLWR
jgi:predicted cation transporter